GRELKALRSALEPVRALALSPNGRFAALAVGSTVSVFDLEAGGLLPDTLTHEEPVNLLRFDHNGQLLFSDSGDDTLKVWNLKTLTSRTLVRPALPDDNMGVADVPRAQSTSSSSRYTIDAEFSADDRLLVTREDNFLRVWDLQEVVQRQR